MIRVRLDHAPSPGAPLELDAAQSHHLSSVLRVRQGEAVTALSSDGSRWSCEVLEVGPPVVIVAHERYQGPDAEPARTLCVAIPTLKGGRTADLVRQLTELGASEIIVYTSLRSVARPDAARAQKQLSRWQTIAQEATRQCGRVAVPLVAFHPGLPPGGDGHVFLWEEASLEASAATVLAEAAACERLTVLVGPEGGLDPQEGRELETNGWRPASLGARLLRAETAAVTAAILGLVALGERGYS